VYDPDEPLVRKSLQKSTAFDPTEKPDSALLGATVRDLSLQLANSDNNNNNNSSSSNVLANGESNSVAGVKPKVSTVLDAVVEVGKPSVRYWGALYGLR
jgi:methyl coenzyme M reductase gamma subunit